MLSPLCVVRWVLRNRFLLAPKPWISGHDFEEPPVERGQPACVQILRCSACGQVDVSWAPCAKCGAKNG